ncbi:MAG: hypothetical protein VW715_16080 [Rhodospirillales bacterium]
MAYTRGDQKNIIVGAAALFIHADGPVDEPATSTVFPAFVPQQSYKDTLSASGNEVWRNVGYTQNGMTITITPDFGEVEVDQLLDSAKIYKQGMQVELATTFAEATLENLLYAIAASPNDLNADPEEGPLADPDLKTKLADSYSGIRHDDANDNYHGGKRDGTGTKSITGPERSGVSLASPVVDPVVSTGPGAQFEGTLSDGMDVLDISSGNLGECPVERALCAIGPGTGDCDESEAVERIYVAFRALSMDAVTVSVTRDAASTFDVNFRLLPANDGRYGRIIDRTYQTLGGPATAGISAAPVRSMNKED